MRGDSGGHPDALNHWIARMTYAKQAIKTVKYEFGVYFDAENIDFLSELVLKPHK